MEKKILIVEDETTLAQALGFKLKGEGFEAIFAGNGIEGLEVAEKSQPDLILCDISMPQMDGFTMLKTMRGTPWGSKIPVIMLTNLNDSGKIADALSENVFSYLVKSDWDLAQVVEKIKEELANSHR